VARDGVGADRDFEGELGVCDEVNKVFGEGSGPVVVCCLIEILDAGVVVPQRESGRFLLLFRQAGPHFVYLH
jgi:hypothetical protein